MPIINVTLGKDQMNTEQKAALVKELTNTSVDIMGIPAQSFTIMINELPLENFGIGGIPLPEVLKDMHN